MPEFNVSLGTMHMAMTHPEVSPITSRAPELEADDAQVMVTMESHKMVNIEDNVDTKWDHKAIKDDDHALGCKPEVRDMV